MKIIDFIVVTYFSIFKKYGLKGLEAGIYFLLFPLTFNLLSVFFYLSYLINSKTSNLISPFVIFFIGFTAAYTARKLLNKIYLEKFKYIRALSDRYPRILLLILPIIHWPVSVFFVFYCLKFT
jgi:hypothetical protein